MDHPEGAGSERCDRVGFGGAQLSSDGGLLVLCELDDALGLRALARWCAPSSPPSAAFEPHRCARDRDPDPN